jgi:hypothetical protein
LLEGEHFHCVVTRSGQIVGGLVDVARDRGFAEVVGEFRQMRARDPRFGFGVGSRLGVELFEDLGGAPMGARAGVPS